MHYVMTGAGMPASQVNIPRINALSYDGASSVRRALKDWWPIETSADDDTIYDLPTLRGRSRDLLRNNGWAAGAAQTTTTNVIGAGLRPKATLDHEYLGLSEDQAEQWENMAERIFRVWCAQCDLTRRQAFAGLQEVAFRAIFEAGDVLAIRRHRQRRGDLLGTKLQLLEAERVCNPHHLPDIDRLIAGVQLDPDGAPTRYHYTNRHPNAITFTGEPVVWRQVPAFGSTGMRLVLHVVRPLRPGQTRGVPVLAPVIEKLKQLARYGDAELMAAVVSAMFTVFVKSEGASDESNTLLESLEGLEQQSGDPKTDYKLGYGTMVGLEPGEDIQTANPGRPNDKFDPFVQSILREVGVAIEIPFELLIKHFTSSYSAARAALLEAWRAFTTKRHWFAGAFCQPSYEFAISEAVARNLLPAPGFLTDPLMRAAWLGTEWHGPGQAQIDPLKEMKAYQVAVSEEFMTRNEVTALTTGGDWERKHRQRTKEERMRREDGLAGADGARDTAEDDTTPDEDDDAEA
jgi:lambda family phage portal protein